MKKLTNISPFILLLVPVFVMIVMIFSLSIQGGTESNEMASRSSVKSSSNLLKADISLK